MTRRQTWRRDTRFFTERCCRRYVQGVMNPSPGCATAAPPFGSLSFERVLLPHRSLPPRGFHVILLILGLISLAVGIGFVSIGAWPVTGFFGLDVALVYLAFRLNYRSARRSETIRLAGDAFTVERVSVRGERRMWWFQPFWLRVILEERGDEWNRLRVASHGRSLVIADFLAPAARRELDAAIREALSRWRDALNPAGAATL
jgi:uncharacterized membrane protein